jgi:hypothetical protein
MNSLHHPLVQVASAAAAVKAVVVVAAHLQIDHLLLLQVVLSQSIEALKRKTIGVTTELLQSPNMKIIGVFHCQRTNQKQMMDGEPLTQKEMTRMTTTLRLMELLRIKFKLMSRKLMTSCLHS